MEGEAREIQLDGVENRQRLFRSNIKTKCEGNKLKEKKGKKKRDQRVNERHRLVLLLRLTKDLGSVFRGDDFPPPAASQQPNYNITMRECRDKRHWHELCID